MRLKLTFVYLSCFVCLATFCTATTTVTGHITKLDTTTPGVTAYCRFWLRGTRGNQPRITGTGAIAPQFSGSAFYVDLPADASGNISGTIYSTRDSTGTGAGDIEAGGSYTAVYYGMQIFNGGVAGPETPVHARSGGTLDIANVTPVSTLPVVTSPNGDTTYARIDGGNTPFSGPVSFASTVTFPGNATFSLTTLSDYSVAGFTKLNNGLFLSSSLVTKGALDLYNNATGVIFRNGVFNGTLGKSGTLQAGDTSSGTATWLANSVYNLPDLAQGGVVDASGFLYGADGTTLNNSVNNCVFGGGSNTTNSAGILKNSGFGCNTNIVFPTFAQAVEWSASSHTGILNPTTLTANRAYLLPDIGGNVGMNGNATNGFYQSKRGVTGCTTGASAGNSCASNITVTWPTAFADTSYSAVCTGMTPTNAPSAPFIISGGKSASTITVNYFAITAAAASFATIDCEATHD